MNVLMVGNGFDLFHKLPTNYKNFLFVVDFIKNNDNVKTIKEVFDNIDLQNKDGFIAHCYNNHKEIYDKIMLDNDKVKEIACLSKNNIWFSYLMKTYNECVGWIDLEKEIANVLKCFDKFLNALNIKFNLKSVMKTQDSIYILDYFSFFFDRIEKDSFAGITTHKIKDEYTIEYPLGSGNIVVDKEKIIKLLFNQLCDLSKILQLYLVCFVEPVISSVNEGYEIERCKAISNIDHIVSFNYTDTYEMLYSDKKVFHLHGNVNDSIILGINPDSADDLDTIDTSFITFKKYYQRTLFGYDEDYLKWLRKKPHTYTDIQLIVMGHSLDVTDKDIIIELFRYAKEIKILYHKPSAKADYISNLLAIFGKEQFDELRREKNLTFMSLDMDFTEFTRECYDKAYERIETMMGWDDDSDDVI